LPRSPYAFSFGMPLLLNFEIMLVTIDSAFAAAVESMLIRDFDQAREITPEDSRDTHRLQQLGMRIARLISPIL